MERAVKRRLRTILAAVALMFGIGTAAARQSQAATTETTATTAASGPITGYQGSTVADLTSYN